MVEIVLLVATLVFNTLLLSVAVAHYLHVKKDRQSREEK
jgi:hypothetical protein